MMEEQKNEGLQTEKRNQQSEDKMILACMCACPCFPGVAGE